MYSRISDLAKKYFSEAVEIRQYLHRFPELSFKEFETTKFIKKRLNELDIPFLSPLETGCIGIIKGGKTSARVIALRADIDALPIKEEGKAKKAFLSESDGVAHCCGHDAHTANLLTVAKILKELQEEIEGKVLLVFQPGEETLPGGGKLLTETGILQNNGVDAIFGLHASPMHAAGIVATKTGPLMATTSEFEVEIIGKGGHAARAHEAIDPIVLASQYINSVQTIASRNVDPTEPVVVTIGKIEGGTAHNIIPERVKMWGTARTLLPETEELVIEKLEAHIQGITKAAGCSYHFEFNKGYPAVINSEKETNSVFNVAKKLLNPDQIIEMRRPVMAGEDFAFYQQIFPGAFFFVGSASNEADSGYPWHHSKFNIDDRFFKTAIPLMAGLVFE